MLRGCVREVSTLVCVLWAAHMWFYIEPAVR